jgi:hypothetical protein
MKNGGWLDRYDDGGSMQEHQENYNDGQAFSSPDMQGDGYSNVGRNYSPAWGGQFQKGGKIKPSFESFYKTINPDFNDTSNYNLRQAYKSLPYKTLDSWRNDPEHHHLPDTYKLPNHPTFSDESIYFNPKTRSQAGHWAETDSSWTYEPYDTTVKKRIIEKKFDMGGSLPGSVGFTYARTKDIPSNGPYAKKTKASAQNGKEMSFYQNGFDWDAKTISQDGTAVKKQSRDMRTLAERKADDAKELDAKLRAQQSSLQKASSPIKTLPTGAPIPLLKQTEMLLNIAP